MGTRNDIGDEGGIGSQGYWSSTCWFAGNTVKVTMWSTGKTPADDLCLTVEAPLLWDGELLYAGFSQPACDVGTYMVLYPAHGEGGKRVALASVLLGRWEPGLESGRFYYRKADASELEGLPNTVIEQTIHRCEDAAGIEAWRKLAEKHNKIQMVLDAGSF